jgi:DNA-directed RNA polymerase specialized sigma subunit
VRPEVALIKKAREIYRQSKPDDLIGRHMRLALYIADQYLPKARRAGIEWQDVQGQALLSLVEAARDYPKSEAAKKNIPFKAYLDIVVRTDMREMLSKASMAHMPSYKVYREVRELNQAAADLQAKTEKDFITDQELAEALGWPLEKVRTYQRYARALMNYVEFSRPVEGLDKEATFEDVLPDDAAIDEEVISKVDLEREAQWLAEATAGLPEVARAAVYLVFGLPVPESVPGPTFGDVIRIALNHSASAARGVKYLREVRRDERGDMPDLGNQDTSVRISGRKSPAVVAGKEGRDRAKDFWRRAVRERWFPWLFEDKSS